MVDFCLMVWAVVLDMVAEEGMRILEELTSKAALHMGMLSYLVNLVVEVGMRV